MKKQLLLIVSICLIISQSVLAQDPILFQGTWELESLVLDGEAFSPPFNDEIDTVGLTFEDEEGADIFNSWVCNSFFASINFEEGGDESDFSFSFTEDYSITLIECDLAENTIFENQYFNFYLNTMQDPFEYIIEFLGNNPTLIITASNGDAAVYGNPTLSASDFIKPSFSIYPNPSSDQLYINTNQDTGDYKITVFDIQGKQHLTTSKETLISNPLQIQDWASGVYFIRIEDQNGVMTTKRFIKN